MKSYSSRNPEAETFLWALLAMPMTLLKEYFQLSHIKKKLQKLMINMAEKIFS